MGQLIYWGTRHRLEGFIPGLFQNFFDLQIDSTHIYRTVGLIGTSPLFYDLGTRLGSQKKKGKECIAFKLFGCSGTTACNFPFPPGYAPSVPFPLLDVAPKGRLVSCLAYAPLVLSPASLLSFFHTPNLVLT